MSSSENQDAHVAAQPGTDWTPGLKLSRTFQSVFLKTKCKAFYEFGVKKVEVSIGSRGYDASQGERPPPPTPLM